MLVSKICPFMSAYMKNPNLIRLKEYKSLTDVMREKPIGTAAKDEAWWRPCYREAKEIEDAIRNGTYKGSGYDYSSTPDIGKFHSFDEDGLI